MQNFKPTFHIELWNIYQRTYGNIPRTHTSIEGFHNIIQSSVTNTHPSIWKLIPLLMKEEVFVKKKKKTKKCDAKQGDKPTSK